MSVALGVGLPSFVPLKPHTERGVAADPLGCARYRNVHRGRVANEDAEHSLRLTLPARKCANRRLGVIV